MSSRWALPTSAVSPKPFWVLMSLAVAGFGIGATQGGAASVLPSQVTDLSTSVDAVGYSMVAYALGVVVGAPLLMVFLARANRRTVLIWLTVSFVVTTVATVLVTSIEALVAVRFLSGFPHGALLGTGMYVATHLLGKAKRGYAIAFIMVGLTLSLVVGIPGMQYMSELWGWRVAYLPVVLIGLIALAMVWAFVPRLDGTPGASPGVELRKVKGAPVWMAIVMGTLGFSGLGAVFSYIVPLLADTNGFATGAVTIILVGWGVGMTVGSIVGGKLTDTSSILTARRALIVTSILMLLLGLFGDIPAATVAIILTLAVSVQVLSLAIQTHLMDVFPASPALGAATSHAALNAANALGTGLGAIVIGLGWGYLAPAWPALVLTLVALAITYVGAGFKTKR